jgi:hypothetical protein
VIATIIAKWLMRRMEVSSKDLLSSYCQSEPGSPPDWRFRVPKPTLSRRAAKALDQGQEPQPSSATPRDGCAPARLVLFRNVDKRSNQHQDEKDNHPVLKRKPKNKDLPYQPVVHRALRKLEKLSLDLRQLG